jgi:hypothetical protein
MFQRGAKFRSEAAMGHKDDSNHGTHSSLPKTPFRRLAVSGESEHDRRMIAIAGLFVRLLCDRFKPRQRLEAEILICAINSISCGSAPHAD